MTTNKLPKYVLLDKAIGETPLEVLDEFKRTNHAYAAAPLSYAGRLDPLASGKLLVLVGEECKKQKKYIGLDKEYEFEVLVGMSSDTGDVLGIAELSNGRVASSPDKRRIKEVIASLSGKRTIPYPAFSSKTVNGIPLFKYALEGRLDEIEIPTKEVNIYELDYISKMSVTSSELFSLISEKIESIKPVTEHQKGLGNDFRRPQIRKRYTQIQNNISADSMFYILKFRCVCSSGTYMRTLAEDIARGFGSEGLAFSIHRTKIGKYKKIGPIKFWSKVY